LVVGAALGLSGAEMQTILNNPLASPYTLGVSAAAAFGASLAIVLDLTLPHIPQTWLISANAFVFAFGSAMLLDLVARWRGMSTAGVVLMGIALVFSFHALVELMQFVASADALQGLVFWTLGSLARADWQKVVPGVCSMLGGVGRARRAAGLSQPDALGALRRAARGRAARAAGQG
ncbi:iron chelate uptake ABC transporter family permease subunit, partial [Burkholderia gladioli]|nr:iron chelate uptake ABC transporter family permease subunit [Burkholderia gladioli]